MNKTIHDINQVKYYNCQKISYYVNNYLKSKKLTLVFIASLFIARASIEEKLLALNLIIVFITWFGLKKTIRFEL